MLTILDGGMGRELKRVGAPFSQPLWSAQALLESPQHVTQVHQSFVEAGAEIIITNAYACVPFHLGDERFQQQGAALARSAANIARKVADNHKGVLVAGCLPPAMGSYRPDLFDVAKATPILETLIQAQAPYIDLWMVETLASIKEFETNHGLLSNSDKPCHYAFTLMDEPLGENAQLRSGETVTDAALKVAESGASGMLFNCSIPEVLEQAVIDAKTIFDQKGAKITIGAYANNFDIITPDHQANGSLQSIRALTPEDYLEFAKTWQQAGAEIIGGCCGIGPEYIQVLAEWKTKGAI
ncbi:homocysteine S-methyltransferase family protein [Vibrio sp. MarTm2]|uniref:homocysteine S-methyltransferase family protein n=1 Tax=Vibrio sp. MarTm2 TaxID=2998831 RepID=UPI0022CD3778|nr:homocysteine S-methyltransferase family protein [Vibrio sp. MarTm2]MDA0127820.1 homocysteine S-methyltransferase family protein [Vibrio sp. MarTm2]